MGGVECTVSPLGGALGTNPKYVCQFPFKKFEFSCMERILMSFFFIFQVFISTKWPLFGEKENMKNRI